MIAWAFRLLFIIAVCGAIYCTLYSAYSAKWPIEVEGNKTVVTAMFVCRELPANRVQCKNVYEMLTLKQKVVIWCMIFATVMGLIGVMWALLSCATSCCQRALDTPLPIFALFSLCLCAVATILPLTMNYPRLSEDVKKNLTSFAVRSPLFFRTLATGLYAVAFLDGSLSDCIAY